MADIRRGFETVYRKYDVVIEPDDHERLDDNVPPIVALSFFRVLWAWM